MSHYGRFFTFNEGMLLSKLSNSVETLYVGLCNEKIMMFGGVNVWENEKRFISFNYDS